MSWETWLDQYMGLPLGGRGVRASGLGCHGLIGHANIKKNYLRRRNFEPSWRPCGRGLSTGGELAVCYGHNLSS